MPRQQLLIPLLVCTIFSAVSFGQTEYPDPPAAVIKAAISSFHEYDNGNTFDTYLQSGPSIPSTVNVIASFDPTPGAGVVSEPYPHPHIMGIVGRSDFVGTGIPLEQWSYAAVGNCFVVSIFLVHVTEVVVPGKDFVATGRDIYIVRAGGPVQYKGHTMLAVDPKFPMFHRDLEYIFFGKEVGSNLYKVDSDTALEVHNEAVTETGIQPRNDYTYRGRDKTSILAEALLASQIIAARKQGGAH